MSIKMNTNTPVKPSPEETGVSRAVLKRLLQVVGQFLTIAVILFVTAGRLDWGWAWAYLGLGLGIVILNALILSPELIAERGQPKENVKGWDRALTTLSIFPTLGMLIVAGLDERFGWSPPLAPAAQFMALAVLALGQLLFSWAMAANKYFSTLVRIQLERGHTVASGGPYRYVRHPGYAGYITFTLATPLALGSWWGIIFAGLTACIFVIRTALEDRTLQGELPGYKDYAQQVRYRLLPGVW